MTSFASRQRLSCEDFVPDWRMDIWSATLMLLIIMDPLGNIPTFHSILNPVPEERRRAIILRELLIALGILFGFLFAGQYLLSFLGLSQPALSIGGGVVLFLIAIHMVFPQHGLDPGREREDPFIVPLAVPLVAGPSAIAALLLLARREPDRMFEWVGALAIAWAVTALVLLASDRIMNRVGRRGLRAVEKLMGMLLILIAIQMLLDGIDAYRDAGLAASQN